jgi:hypothetical protein
LELAHLLFVKPLEHFHFSFRPSIDERQISELRTLRFRQQGSSDARHPLFTFQISQVIHMIRGIPRK